MVQIRGVRGGDAETYFLYVAQDDDEANEEDGLFTVAISKMVQIRGVRGGDAEPYFLYVAQGDDEANEEGGLFLRSRRWGLHSCSPQIPKGRREGTAIGT